MKKEIIKFLSYIELAEPFFTTKLTVQWQKQMKHFTGNITNFKVCIDISTIYASKKKKKKSKR